MAAFLCVCGLSGRSSDRQTKQLELTADTASVQIPREGFDRAFTSLTYTTQTYAQMTYWYNLHGNHSLSMYLSIFLLVYKHTVFAVILHLYDSDFCPSDTKKSPLGSINLSEVRWSNLANLSESVWDYNVPLMLQLLSEVWVCWVLSEWNCISTAKLKVLSPIFRFKLKLRKSVKKWCIC